MAPMRFILLLVLALLGIQATLGKIMKKAVSSETFIGGSEHIAGPPRK